MLTILPLITSLALPVAVSGYTNSEKRTLHSAITSALYSNAIWLYYQQCKEAPENDTGVVPLVAKQRRQLLQLLKQAVHTDDIDVLLQFDSKLTQQHQHGLVTPKDCNDNVGLQRMLDNYELAIFSLEIALPLSRSLAKPVHTNKRSNEVELLISRSTVIAQVSISDKTLLSAIQQANFLHLDYQSRYIFKVEQGWKNPAPAYLGMHKYVEDSQLNSTSKQWLIFLDKNNHFLKAIELNKASPYLKLLKQPDWRFDSLGNLQRF